MYYTSKATHLPTYQPTYPPTQTPTYPPTYLPTSLPPHLPAYLPIASQLFPVKTGQAPVPRTEDLFCPLHPAVLGSNLE